MRQNGATISLLLYCVSYEILRETRIKPSFFGNCLISLSSALGAQCLGSQFAGVAPQAIRALGSWSLVGTVQDRPSRQARRSLPLVLIKRIAHVRGGGSLPSPPSFGGHLPQRGRRDLAFCKPLVSCLLGSPFGGAGTAAAVTERASSRDAGAVRRLRGQNLALLPSFREATFSALRRPGKTLRCFPSFFSG